MLEAQHHLASGCVQDLWRQPIRIAGSDHRRAFQGSCRLVGYTALGRLGLYAPCHRACRPARTSGASHCAPAQSPARRAPWRSPCQAQSSFPSAARARGLAAVGGCNLVDPDSRRSQLRSGGGRSGKAIDPSRERISEQAGVDGERSLTGSRSRLPLLSRLLLSRPHIIWLRAKALPCANTSGAAQKKTQHKRGQHTGLPSQGRCNGTFSREDTMHRINCGLCTLRRRSNLPAVSGSRAASPS